MNSSLSTSLKMFLWYFLFSIVGVAVCAALYMIYVMCLSMVAGHTIVSFSASYFLHGLLIYAPLVLEVNVLLMIFYQIRHPAFGFLPVFAFVLLGAGTWFGLAPLFNNILVDAEQKEIFEMEKSPLSAGYFRTYGDEIVFYSSVNDESVASGMVIDMMGDQDSIYTFSNEIVPDQSASPSSSGFKDNLIQESMEPPKMIQFTYDCVHSFTELQRYMITKGWLAWTMFAIMGIALISVVGFRNCSKWRLLNVLMALIFSVLILFVNIESYEADSFMAPVVQSVNRGLSLFKFIDNPFAVLFNVVCAVIFSILGCVFDSKVRRSGEQ